MKPSSPSPQDHLLRAFSEAYSPWPETLIPCLGILFAQRAPRLSSVVFRQSRYISEIQVGYPNLTNTGEYWTSLKDRNELLALVEGWVVQERLSWERIFGGPLVKTWRDEAEWSVHFRSSGSGGCILSPHVNELFFQWRSPQ